MGDNTNQKLWEVWGVWRVWEVWGVWEDKGENNKQRSTINQHLTSHFGFIFIFAYPLKSANWVIL